MWRVGHKCGLDGLVLCVGDGVGDTYIGVEG